MRNLFKYIGISAVLVFSFYYTEKMSNIVINNSSLVNEINENVNNYNIQAVSALIDGDYIIPGLNGSTVNVLKSYNNMKFLDTFNSYYLVYDKTVPMVSLENNKDKIIKRGNSSKESVSIIVKDNQEIIDYSLQKNIEITRLININTFNKSVSYEQINFDVENYKKVESLLNNSNLNNNICFINNKNNCDNSEKYLVESTVTLTNYNLGNIKSDIKSGYIIFINDDVSVTDYKILIRQIYYQDLDIISLSKLITEERD